MAGRETPRSASSLNWSWYSPRCAPSAVFECYRGAIGCTAAVDRCGFANVSPRHRSRLQRSNIPITETLREWGMGGNLAGRVRECGRSCGASLRRSGWYCRVADVRHPNSLSAALYLWRACGEVAGTTATEWSSSVDLADFRAARAEARRAER